MSKRKSVTAHLSSLLALDCVLAGAQPVERIGDACRIKPIIRFAPGRIPRHLLQQAQTRNRAASVDRSQSTESEANIPEGLTVFAFPAGFRKQLRTTNGLERLNREIRRRTRVVSIFPNEAACLRLISAILVEIDEEWQTGKLFLTIGAEAGQL